MPDNTNYSSSVSNAVDAVRDSMQSVVDRLDHRIYPIRTPQQIMLDAANQDLAAGKIENFRIDPQTGRVHGSFLGGSGMKTYEPSVLDYGSDLVKHYGSRVARLLNRNPGVVAAGAVVPTAMLTAYLMRRRDKKEKRASVVYRLGERLAQSR